MTGLEIVVVDDDLAVRDALATVLSLEGHRVIPFPDGEQFLNNLDKVSPDLVFLDLKMPNMTGHDVLERLDKPVPFPIVMISAHADIAAAVQAVRLGAVEFIEKPVSAEALLQSVETAQKIYREASLYFRPGSNERLSSLTVRERDVVKLLVEGLTNKEVARELSLSPRTIEAHRANIFQKLELKNLAGLVRLYHEA